MKLKHRICNYAALCGLMASLSLSACSDDINVNVFDKDPNEGATESIAFLTHKGLPNTSADVDLRESDLTRFICLNLTQGTATSTTAQVEIVSDANLVASYNMANGTNYKEYPVERVSLENDGVLTVEPWRTASEPLGVTFDEEAGGTPIGQYVLPIRVKGDGTGMLPDKRLLWFRISVDKVRTIAPRDVQPVACVQVNGTNPLNAGLYTLRGSGEPFFSQVTLFSANINWDARQKKAIVTFNENLTPLLENRNKYIKPLQDKGIKVTLGLLGNRDGVCFRNYTQQGALDFAKEIKAVIEAFGLDGVFMDEEYMNYGSNGLPTANSTSWGYLCYYLKQLMPNKLVTVYTYDINSDFKGTTLGEPTGSFVDYAFRYASDSWTPNGYTDFNGMDKRKWGPWSAIIYDDYDAKNYGGGHPNLDELRGTTRQGYLKQVKDNYGAVFFYNLVAFCPAIPSYMENAANDFGPNGFDASTRAYDYSDYLTEYAKVLLDGDEVFRDGMPIPNDYSPGN
ncbi:MAG: DUF1735 domain-containing protein [Mediterranea sp.]|jgi:hypothetical protein|nr:DUF1735 domain-containing protein [Mediterranea sp.]